MADTMPVKEIRCALRKSLPATQPSLVSGSTMIPFTYMPSSHARALEPDRVLVEGMRGAGKSWWWRALADENHRKFVSEAFPEAGLNRKIEVKAGFGVPEPGKNDTFPDKDTLSKLATQFDPRQIWRTVLAQNIGFTHPYPSCAGTWSERVKWVNDSPEEYNALLNAADDRYTKDDGCFILIFDALDLLAGTWKEIRPLAKALFQFAMDITYRRSIRFKLFVRPDMMEDPEILAFPDSSKLRSQNASLEWRKVDLYALMFQCIGNDHDNGAVIRQWMANRFGAQWTEGPQQIWLIPDKLKLDETLQREVFHSIAGKYMGPGESGYKRGFPYSWLTNHLGDTNGQISPRTFAAALRSAAEKTPDTDPNPVNYKSIKQGVQGASEIRVNEIKEDYPWVKEAMEPLKKIVIPCEPDTIINRWKEQGAIERIRDNTTQKLAPLHLENGAEGVLEDLEKLKIIEELSNGRIQMPDIYRIAFGMGRRGGVKPVR